MVKIVVMSKKKIVYVYMLEKKFMLLKFVAQHISLMTLTFDLSPFVLS